VINVLNGQKQVYPYALFGGSLFYEKGVNISQDGRYLMITTENRATMFAGLNCMVNHPVFLTHTYIFDRLTNNKRCGTPNLSLFFPLLNAFIVNDNIRPFADSNQSLSIASLDSDTQGTPEFARLLPSIAALRSNSGDGSKVAFKAAGPTGDTILAYVNVNTGETTELAQYSQRYPYYNMEATFSNDGKKIVVLSPDDNNANQYFINVADLE
jgi:hypothetical protein